MKKTVVILGLITFCSTSAKLWAAEGEQTISISYASIQSDALKNAVRDYGHRTDAFVSGYNASGSSYTASGRADSYNDMRGITLKYRYEMTDQWGVVAAFSHVSQEFKGTVNASKEVKKGPTTTTTYAWSSSDAYGSVKGTLNSLLVGPSYRLNDYVSGYALAGVAKTKIEYRQAQSMGSSDSASSWEQNKTSVAYGLGLQINPVKNIAIDLAWEGSGTGEWQTRGFNIGLGYSF
ncbi:outer membrane beta-barrel protein [Salmonella enterica subsp. enterica]|nr:hypothetical protein [Salmonella enterica]EAW1477797.1 hypothetical protein [Salmonella enterica subsp. enterica]EED9463118.1 Ail/Lom family outer membrane beta-barrel protein [Salmonella enterica subsp. enterica serovar Abaetetuba]EBP8535594.1 outer membrane beta-barrel protein [Salmonella enterica]EBR1114050.1 outer membrane beta-barrel protein [Salmonella enterica]